MNDLARFASRSGRTTAWKKVRSRRLRNRLTSWHKYLR